MALTVLGELEQFIAEDLYPLRYPITVALVIAAAAGLYLAYRLGLHRIAWRHKLISGAAVVIFLAAAVPTGDYFLSPLWERSFLEEESPLAMASTGDLGSETDDGTSDATPTPTPTPVATPADLTEATAVPIDESFEPHVDYEGEFTGSDDFHFGRGKALLIETRPGVYTLRLEEFSVRNGPDLFVYLSPSAEGYADGFLDLGGLKATDGAFNYEVPAGTDVTQFKSAIIWCKQFSVLFATAPFEPAS